MPASPQISPSFAPAPPAADRVLRAAAELARDRLGALPGVRALASAQGDSARVAVDVRDTGRDGRQVACALAGRGIAVEAAGGRALVVRLRRGDVAEALHERLAPALLQALWSVRPRQGFELALDLPDRRRAR